MGVISFFIIFQIFYLENNTFFFPQQDGSDKETEAQ